MKQETGTQEILHEAEKQHAMAGVPEETREAVIQAQHEFFERQWGEVRCAANERTAATVDIGPCHIQKWAAHHIQAAGVQVATDDAQCGGTTAISSEVIILSGLSEVKTYCGTAFDKLTLPSKEGIAGFMVVLDAGTRWRLTMETEQAAAAGRKRTRNGSHERSNEACSHDTYEIGFDKDGSAAYSVLAVASQVVITVRFVATTEGDGEYKFWKPTFDASGEHVVCESRVDFIFVAPNKLYSIQVRLFRALFRCSLPCSVVPCNAVKELKRGTFETRCVADHPSQVSSIYHDENTRAKV